MEMVLKTYCGRKSAAGRIYTGNKKSAEMDERMDFQEENILKENYDIWVSYRNLFCRSGTKNSNGKIYWGYFTSPQNMEGANQSVLMGFRAKITMEPYGIIHVCTMDSAEQKKKQGYLIFIMCGENTW